MGEPLFLEENDPDRTHPELAGKWRLADKTDLKYLELIKYPDREDLEQLEGRVDESTLPGWLSRFPNKASEPGSPLQGDKSQQPSSGVRLLYGECSFKVPNGVILPWNEESFNYIEEHLALPERYMKILHAKGQRAFKHTSHIDGIHRTCFLFKAGVHKPSYYHFAITFNHTTNQTHGFLVCKTHEHHYDLLISRLKSTPECAQQPLLLFVILIDILIDFCNEMIQKCDRAIFQLESAMGQLEFSNLMALSPGQDTKPPKIDYIATTRRLNFAARIQSIEVMRLECMLLSLGKVEKWVKVYFSKPGISEGGEGEKRVGKEGKKKEEEDAAYVFIEEEIEYCINAAQMSLLRVLSGTKRKDALVQLGYQFKAQEDALVNIQHAETSATLAKASRDDSEVMQIIAFETKKDSHAMKTIAILGMFFLPGAFVASIFAMPVFNWDDSNGAFLNTGFKYYWATTVPLTVAVFVFWGVYTVGFKRLIGRKGSGGRDGDIEMERVTSRGLF